MTKHKKHKCDRCLNSRPVVSENGLHWVCTLHYKKSIACFTGEKDWFLSEEMTVRDALDDWNRRVTDDH